MATRAQWKSGEQQCRPGSILPKFQGYPFYGEAVMRPNRRVKRKYPTLFPQSSPNPQCSKHRQCHDQNNYSRGESNIEVAVRVIYAMPAKEIPRQQRENSDGRRREKREERRSKNQQQTCEKPKAFQRKSKEFAAACTMGLRRLHSSSGLSRLEYSFMPSSAQIELWHAEKVVTQVTVGAAANGIHFAAWGETRVNEPDLERLVGAVPAGLAPALNSRTYYFVPL